MNNLSTIIILFFLSITTGCLSQNKDGGTKDTQTKEELITKIELTEKTRGTNRSIIFSNNTVLVNVNNKTKTSALASSHWDSIVKEIKAIDMEKLPTYEAPTSGRFSDAALASTIIITVNGKTYISNEFDAGVPPTNLEKLYKKLKESTGGLEKNSSRPPLR